MISRFLLLLTLLAGFSAHPLRAADEKVIITTDLGEIVIRLNSELSPLNVAAFKDYIAKGVYKDSTFDDCDAKDSEWISGGKPGSKQPGIGSSGNMLASKGPAGEFKLKHTRGIVGFRRTAGSCNPEKRSNSTQFTIGVLDMPAADGEYTAFATVEKGMEVADALLEKLKKKEKVAFSIKLVES